MSSKEILESNKEKLSELIQVKVDIDENGDGKVYSFLSIKIMFDHLFTFIYHRFHEKSLTK